jgi:uncharacterized membrane protein YqiK
MSGYRDELQAAQARIDALEQELASARNRGLVTTSLNEDGARENKSVAAFPFGWVSVVLFGVFLFALHSDNMVFGVAAALITGAMLPVFGGIAVMSRLFVTASPSELLVISGRASYDADGTFRAYTVVRRGRAIVYPLIHRVDRLDTSVVPIDTTIHGAYTRDRSSIAVRVTAAVRLFSDGPEVHSAVERFLGRSREDLQRVARESIEGAAREVIATRTEDSLRYEPTLVGEMARDAAEDALRALGIELDALRIELLARTPP